MLKFVEVNNDKKPMHKFTEAKTSYKEMKNAALLVPENVVVIDFDGDNVSSRKEIYDEKIVFYLLEKYKPYWTKSRPYHYQLYFKVPNGIKLKMGADILTLGGFQVDYRVGKNSLAIIKTNGQLRECACELTEKVLNNLPILPPLCYPLYQNNSHTCFAGLIEGQGRNNLMFLHLVFSKKRYPKVNLNEVAYFINHELIKEPLEDKIVDNMVVRSPIYANKTNSEISTLTYEYKEIKLIKFSDVKVEEPKWIWKPYIPLGTLVLLVGDPGIGKSYIALYIASLLSNGTKFPFDENNENKVLDPCKVLFQNGEDGVSYTLGLRLDKLGANKENIFMIDESQEIFKINQLEVLETVIANNNIKMVIIDPIQRYIPNNTSMDKANEVRNVLSPLRELAEKYDCTIMLIMHQNKSKTNNSLYKALGSIDFVGACRSMLSVEKINNKCYIVHSKSSLTAQGKPIMYQINENGFEILGLSEEMEDDNDSSKFDLAKRFIQENLSKGPITSIDIKFKALSEKISISTLKRAKKELNVKSYQINNAWYWSFDDELDYEKANKRYINK